MAIIPGYKGGGRPRIGERVELRVSDGALARIDAVVHEAARRYDRVPKALRSRQSVIRACIDAELEALEGRVLARPEPD